MMKPEDEAVVRDILEKSLSQAKELNVDSFYLIVINKNFVSPQMANYLTDELQKHNIKHALVRCGGNPAEAIAICTVDAVPK